MKIPSMAVDVKVKIELELSIEELSGLIAAMQQAQTYLPSGAIIALDETIESFTSVLNAAHRAV